MPPKGNKKQQEATTRKDNAKKCQLRDETQRRDYDAVESGSQIVLPRHCGEKIKDWEESQRIGRGLQPSHQINVAPKDGPYRVPETSTMRGCTSMTKGTPKQYLWEELDPERCFE
ncbi:hypothetical protein HAX54_028668 [Datura stramonium]|uniref:Uncharacterized protein n=1 Tax=Datura stramonium TaxID=4076 RepID=A0ABS8V7B0_DATST|nr:hypothetical protein [Datura stramonium]